MSRTIIRDKDGNVIQTTETASGCLSGCGMIFWVVLALFVIGAPATYFPLWLAVLAYALEGLMVLALIHTKLTEHRWPWEPKPPVPAP